MARDQSRDGLSNQFEFALLAGGLTRPLWKLVQAVPFLGVRANALLIDRAVNKAAGRPYPLSTRGEYPSWDSLVDRTWSGRHLPPASREWTESRPPIEEVVGLFERTKGTVLDSKSTVLFANFAQWFTDGFLRTDLADPLKNTSNHDVDLSPLYDLSPKYTAFVRSGEGGRLKSQIIDGAEWPLFHFLPNGEPAPEFRDHPIVMPRELELDNERKGKLFAFGGDRANVSIGYAMMNVLFLREHNRLCKELQKENPSWDDERLFQTARMVVIVLVIKLVIEEYINHITPYHFQFRMDVSRLGRATWQRPNWMTIEFNLLYRWHTLVPDELVFDEATKVPIWEAIYNNGLLISKGLGPWIDASSRQPAGRIGLGNTTRELLRTERASVELGRRARLRSYNDYRAAFSYPRLTSFEQLTGDPDRQRRLKAVYPTIDDIEFYVGLFAEDVRPNSALPPLVGRMVGVDAFSQALTNPLLAPAVFRPANFGAAGWRAIKETRVLADVVGRNLPESAGRVLVAMTQGQERWA